MDYVIPRARGRRHLCTRSQQVPRTQAQLHVSAGAQTMGNCPVAFGSLKPTSFKVQYIQKADHHNPHESSLSHRALLRPGPDHLH